jgi:hypothetical protein
MHAMGEIFVRILLRPIGYNVSPLTNWVNYIYICIYVL